MKPFQYHLFADMKEDKEYNFYGVIFDSSFPILIKNPTNEYYEVTLKLIDPSLNCLSNPSGILTLIIKSQQKEGMPYIHSIGDIIRVHKGSYSSKTKTVLLYLTAITKILSEWSLFSGKKDSESQLNTPIPLQRSSSNFSIDNEDKENIFEMRNWIYSNFQLKNSLNYLNDVKLIHKKTGDKDINSSLVQIENKFECGERMVYLIQDETERCLMHSPKYFNFFEKSDILRINNYYINNGQIFFRKNSNMMLLPKFSDLQKTFINGINKSIQFLDKNFDVQEFISGNDFGFNRNGYDENCNCSDDFWHNSPKDGDSSNKKQDEYSNSNNEKEKLAKNLNKKFEEDAMSIDEENDENSIKEISLIETKKNITLNNYDSKYSFDNQGKIMVKFLEVIYPSEITNCISWKENKYILNIVFLCEELKNKEKIVLHFNNFDDEGNGLIINNNNFFTQNEENEEIIQSLMKNIEKLIGNNNYFQIQAEYVKLTMVDENNNTINSNNHKELGIYRIVGKYSSK